MRNRLTKLEIIGASKPKILTITRTALDKGKSSERIAAHLNRLFHLHITKSTVEKFRLKRWARERQELATQKTTYAAKAQLIKERGLDAAAQALLFEQVRQLNPAHLLGILRLKIAKEKLKLAKKALAQHAQDPTGTINGLPQYTAEQRADAAEKVKNAIGEIFGVKETSRWQAWPIGLLLIDDTQDPTHEHCITICGGNRALNHEMLQVAWDNLCNPEGFYGRHYTGPNKEQAIARLRELYTLEHLPWPEPHGFDQPKRKPTPAPEEKATKASKPQPAEPVSVIGGHP
jgi:hypothetical protein